MKWYGLAMAVLAGALGALALLAFGAGGRDGAGAEAAQRAALHWTGAELTDAPRRDGDVWEVDVRRADGSLVEVTSDRASSCASSTRSAARVERPRRTR